MSGLISVANTYRPEPHPDAAAFGYNSITFFDGFDSLNTVDLTGSNAPGFNWYATYAWPYASCINHGGITIMGTSSQITAPTMSNSILTINYQNSGTDNNCLLTAGPSGTGHVGQTFSNGFYIEYVARENPALANHMFAIEDPIVFAIPIEFFIGTSNDIVEFDFFECYTDGSEVFAGLHEWTMTPSSATQIGNTNILTNLNQVSLKFNEFHKFGVLWVPMAKNSGTGLIRYYYDGVHISASDVMYSTTGTVSPGMDSPNPIGALSVMDSQNYVLILQCGYQWPNLLDYICVWQ